MRVIGIIITFIFISSNFLFAQKAKQYYYYENKNVIITLSADKMYAKYTDSIVFNVVLKNISDDDILYLKNSSIGLGAKYFAHINIMSESSITFMIEMGKLEPYEEKIYLLAINLNEFKDLRNYGLLSTSLEMQYITDMKRFKRADKKRVKWIDDNSLLVSSEIINSGSEYFNTGVFKRNSK
jgi:hypothetical protein